MPKHNVNIGRYRAVLRQLDVDRSQAVGLIERALNDGSMLPDRRQKVCQTAREVLAERVAEGVRQLETFRQEDAERARAATLPKVNAANVQEAAYWQAHAASLFASLPPEAVPDRLARSMIDAGPVARDEMTRAAEARTTGAGWETKQAMSAVRNKFMTDDERTQRAGAAAVSAIETRWGFMAESAQRGVDEVRVLVEGNIKRQAELPNGVKFHETSGPPPVFHPTHYENAANGFEKAADDAAERAWSATLPGASPFNRGERRDDA